MKWKLRLSGKWKRSLGDEDTWENENRKSMGSSPIVQANAPTGRGWRTGRRAAARATTIAEERELNKFQHPAPASSPSVKDGRLIIGITWSSPPKSRCSKTETEKGKREKKWATGVYSYFLPQRHLAATAATHNRRVLLPITAKAVGAGCVACHLAVV